jgi:hypothetical protein
MEDPKLKVKVVHSMSKPAYNIVGIAPMGCKFKIARVPYVESEDKEVLAMNKAEALSHADFICGCFNNSTELFKLIEIAKAYRNETKTT